MPSLLARTSLIVAAFVLAPAALAHEGHVHHPDAEPLVDAAANATATPLFTIDGFLARLAASRVRMETRGNERLIAANGLPDHETGRFPNRGNPNAIAAQQYQFRMPLDPAPPAEASQPRATGRYVFGVALNGVPFDPGTAENWTANGIQRGGRPTGWKYEALGGAVQLGVDQANAHVQPTGAYHYHGIPTPILSPNLPTLLGYAADGYPIYGPLGYEDPMDATSKLVHLQPSYELKTEPRPDLPQGPGGKPDGSFTEDWQYTQGLGDLDEANGRFGVTPEYPDGTYHYVLTEAFPHIPRHFAGTPDDSFRKRGGGDRANRGERGERGQRPPRGDRPERR